MKDRILNVAAQLIKHYGIRKFTIDEIAVQLKISKKTIYRYFSGKDDIIRCYITANVASDKESVNDTLSSNAPLLEKIRAVVHSTHIYPMPTDLLNEIKQFYPEQWNQIEELKQFKTTVLLQLGKTGVKEGLFRSNICWPVLLRMIQGMTDMFTDYDFLINNSLKTTDAIDTAFDIILRGIQV
ncbi:MAG: TetR/AcrR family transcriptional regulator [Treponema sp.]|jgi:AcrR family transcriptional regulator|nr:TetR/AcrR family transcriptional regulator [Treponema sp.]